MLARVTGILESIDGAKATVAVAASGVAYELTLTALLAEELPGRVGETVTLHTVELLESPNQGASFTPRLLAFGTREDRRLFELLTSVKGLGPRKAMRALAAPAADVATAIRSADLRWLQQLPEIGKKMAESIVRELEGKLDDFAGAAPAAGARSFEGKPAARSAASQAAGALVLLGESPADADRLVRAAIEADAALATVEAILAAALARKG